MVPRSPKSAVLKSLLFREQGSFMAGEFAAHLTAWAGVRKCQRLAPPGTEADRCLPNQHTNFPNYQQ